MSTNPEIILEQYISGKETWNYYVISDGVVQYVYSVSVFRQPGHPAEELFLHKKEKLESFFHIGRGCGPRAGKIQHGDYQLHKGKRADLQAGGVPGTQKK